MAMAMDDFWRECVSWLVKIKIIPENHSMNLHKLSALLRDGVILCHLSNQLDPNLDLKDFNKKPQMAQVINFVLEY
jgi:hypothetical protein